MTPPLARKIFAAKLVVEGSKARRALVPDARSSTPLRYRAARVGRYAVLTRF